MVVFGFKIEQLLVCLSICIVLPQGGIKRKDIGIFMLREKCFKMSEMHSRNSLKDTVGNVVAVVIS